MKSQVEEKFSEFYEGWVVQLEKISCQLLSSSNRSNNNGEQLEALISKATAHYKEFYSAKWAATHEDVLAFFSPVWLTPLETANLWFTGWKPSLTFRLLLRCGGVRMMTEEQRRQVDELRKKIRAEEERVERQMEGQQVAMAADRRMVEMAREARAAEATEAEEGAVRGVLAGLEKVVRAADCVRLRAMKGALDVLSPPQKADFLVGSSMLLMEMRKWGKKRGEEEEEALKQRNVVESSGAAEV